MNIHRWNEPAIDYSATVAHNVHKRWRRADVYGETGFIFRPMWHEERHSDRTFVTPQTLLYTVENRGCRYAEVMHTINRTELTNLKEMHFVPCTILWQFIKIPSVYTWVICVFIVHYIFRPLDGHHEASLGITQRALLLLLLLLLLAFTTHLRVLDSSFLEVSRSHKGHTTVGRTPLDE